ncbi:MAG: hypothetical protein LBG49_02710 [Mycoplasmataceae bacterium]|nr:hypothetical protein [Mycoplasmataceae bacterium]
MSKSLPLIIGAFDGLHYGHQKLFNTVNGKFNVLLIANSPKKVNKSLFLISDRQSILKQCFNEINKVYVYDLRTQSKNSNKFIQYIKNINPKCVVVGNNWRFGKNRMCTHADLQKYFNVSVVAIDKKYSISKVKELIANGDVDRANKLLISKYYARGVVVHGKHLGAKLGYKTANIILDNNLILPCAGCYCSFTQINNRLLPSATFVNGNLIETHIFAFDKNIYGKTIKVYLDKYIQANTKAKDFADLQKIIKNKINKIKNSLSLK